MKSRARMLQRQANQQSQKIQQEAEDTAKVLEEKTKIAAAIKEIEEKSGGWRGMVSSVMDSPVGRALDLVSRLNYGTNEFYKGSNLGRPGGLTAVGSPINNARAIYEGLYNLVMGLQETVRQALVT